MITIQGFAKLCGCNTQTLRYYDRIGLLTPARVDGWTGYRYYEEDQALLFIKIKNLQQADFTIEEIRGLLSEDEDHLMAAFDRKIAEQMQKLEQIRKIQHTYLSDRMKMQEMIRMLTGLMAARADDSRLLGELGLDDEHGAAVAAKARELLAGWLSECGNTQVQPAWDMNSEDLKTVLDYYSGYSSDITKPNIASPESEDEKDIPAGASLIFEKSGWLHVNEWIGELPDPGSGKQTFFCFRVRRDSAVNDPGFPTLMLAVMASLHEGFESGISCRVSLSEDGINRFSMLQK